MWHAELSWLTCVYVDWKAVEKCPEAHYSEKKKTSEKILLLKKASINSECTWQLCRCDCLKLVALKLIAAGLERMAQMLFWLAQWEVNWWGDEGGRHSLRRLWFSLRLPN